jgi:hypothetical protein
MMTIEIDELSNVTGGRLARSTPYPGPLRPDNARFFVPQGLKRHQITTEQSNKDSHARVNIFWEVKQARPWLTWEQAKNPKYVEEFMHPW